MSAPNSIDIQAGAINVKQAFEKCPIGDFLHALIHAYEGCRQLEKNSDGQTVAKCTAEGWDGIVRQTVIYAYSLAGEVAKEIAAPLVETGYRAALDNMPQQAQNQTPKMKGRTLHAAAGIDSEALVTTIAEQLRMMFETGFEHGKIDRQQPARVVSAVNKVERGESGDITQAVTTYTYEDALGVQPPPL